MFYTLFYIWIIYTKTLNEFDIQNEEDCVSKTQHDFCSKYTTSYIGKYHIAYKFSRDNDILFFLLFI